MSLLKFWKRKPKKKIPKGSKEAEKLFDKGEILIVTDLRDYVDLKEFKEKTAHLPEIKDKIERLEYERQI